MPLKDIKQHNELGFYYEDVFSSDSTKIAGFVRPESVGLSEKLLVKTQTRTGGPMETIKAIKIYAREYSWWGPLSKERD